MNDQLIFVGIAALAGAVLGGVVASQVPLISMTIGVFGGGALGAFVGLGLVFKSA